jgi:hypothetical protein
MVVLIIAAILAPLGLASLIIAWRLGRPFRIAFDEAGLRWCGPLGKRRTLAWSEARSFICVNYLAQDDLVTIYSLIGEREALIWRAHGEPGSPDLSPGTLTLWALIGERTGLPLRDLAREAHIISAKAALPLAMTSMTTGRTQRPGAGGNLSASPFTGTMANVTHAGEPARKDGALHRMKTLGIIGSPAILLLVTSLVLMLRAIATRRSIRRRWRRTMACGACFPIRASMMSRCHSRLRNMACMR